MDGRVEVGADIILLTCYWLWEARQGWLAGQRLLSWLEQLSESCSVCARVAASWRLIKTLACDSPLNLPQRCDLSLMDSSRERRERARMRKIIRAEARSSNILCGVMSINRSWGPKPQAGSRLGSDLTSLYSLRDNDYQWREIHGSAWVCRRVMGRCRPV